MAEKFSDENNNNMSESNNQKISNTERFLQQLKQQPQQKNRRIPGRKPYNRARSDRLRGAFHTPASKQAAADLLLDMKRGLDLAYVKYERKLRKDNDEDNGATNAPQNPQPQATNVPVKPSVSRPEQANPEPSQKRHIKLPMHSGESVEDSLDSNNKVATKQPHLPRQVPSEPQKPPVNWEDISKKVHARVQNRGGKGAYGWGVGPYGGRGSRFNRMRDNFDTKKSFDEFKKLHEARKKKGTAQPSQKQQPQQPQQAPEPRKPNRTRGRFSANNMSPVPPRASAGYSFESSNATRRGSGGYSFSANNNNNNNNNNASAKPASEAFGPAQSRKKSRDVPLPGVRKANTFYSHVYTQGNNATANVPARERKQPQPQPSTTHQPRNVPSAPSVQRTSTYSGTQNGQKMSKYDFWSVKMLKLELRRRRVDFSGCLEKSELIVKLVENDVVVAKREAEERKEKEQERLRKRLEREVENWSRGKTFKAMLNDIMGLRTPDKGFLSRTASFTPVSRAYKKALVRIHPDKHINDFEAHIVATEKFKIINENWVQYKEAHESRKKKGAGGRRKSTSSSRWW